MLQVADGNVVEVADRGRRSRSPLEVADRGRRCSASTLFVAFLVLRRIQISAKLIHILELPLFTFFSVV